MQNIIFSLLLLIKTACKDNVTMPRKRVFGILNSYSATLCLPALDISVFRCVALGEVLH